MNTHLTQRSSAAAALSPTARDYARIERALTWLARSRERNPSLEQTASAAGMSSFHFQRVFTRWAGISPKQFLQHLGVSEAKIRLSAGASVLDAALDAGFSGPGRLHDTLVRMESVTPGEYRAGLQDVTIHYGFHDSPFGEALLMTTPRGLCALGFVNGDRRKTFDDLSLRFPRASLVEDAALTAPIVSRVFRTAPHDGAPLQLFVNGSRFQVQVWRALLEIPPGSLCSYDTLARRIGNPKAVRAVGTAIARNPIAYLIPCHRVIRKSGALGDYHWGAGRKLALIGAEGEAGH